MTDLEQIRAAFEPHLRNFFEGHTIDAVTWPRGPIETVLPGFKVMRIAPGPKSALWTYVSNGASRVTRPACGVLEFVLQSPDENSRYVELVTMTAHYHATRGLDVGHTLPIGEPWVPASNCTALLVSRAYPYGPSFEVCKFPEGHLHIYWLLPITEAERQFKISRGMEELETLFEERKLAYWVPDRGSVV